MESSVEFLLTRDTLPGLVLMPAAYWAPQNLFQHPWIGSTDFCAHVFLFLIFPFILLRQFSNASWEIDTLEFLHVF
jgi:hypothetical protein